jgi:hypothetical protein
MKNDAKSKANEKKVSSAKSERLSQFLSSKEMKNVFQKLHNFCHNFGSHYEGVLKISLLSYFEYCQIWLNLLLDDSHLSNITKLELK